MNILFQDVSFAYESADKDHVIDKFTFSIKSGEFVAIIGPSGCGKTSLLRLIAGLQTPTSGVLRFPGLHKRARPKCLMAFQEHGLFPWLSVLDNACIGLEAAGYSRLDRESRAMTVLKRIGLDHIANHKPAALSGGMRQRIALVRLIISEADILLFDEPLSAVDAQTRLFLQQELLDLWSAVPKTSVYVTHDIEEALTLADRVVVLSAKGGAILADILVPTPRPRTAAKRPSPAIEKLRWDIWDLLTIDGQDEVKRGQKTRAS